MILIIYGGAKSMTDLRLNFTLTITYHSKSVLLLGTGVGSMLWTLRMCLKQKRTAVINSPVTPMHGEVCEKFHTT